MRPNELMIGDYVRFKHGIDKVVGVSWVPGLGDCAWFAASATLFPESVEDVNPIPLTPEILENNGFEKSKMYEVWKIICDEYELRVTPWRVAIIFLDEDGADKEEFSMPRPKYVHQLQHALRLCGIEKEIVL